MKCHRLAVALLIGLTLAGSAWAEPARLEIPYSMKVALQEGRSYTFRFSLWNNADPASTDGEMVWSEVKRLPLAAANVVHRLGSATTLEGVDFSRQLWVQVDRLRLGVWLPLGARTILNMAPYALWSKSVETNSITGNSILDGTVGAADLTDGAALAEILDNDGTGSGLDADTLDGSHATAFASSTHNHPGLVGRCSPGQYLAGFDEAGDAICQSFPPTPPVLNPVGNKVAEAGALLEFTTSASDINADTLNYAAANVPEGAAFNAGTRTFSWTPEGSQIGDHTVTFSVSDGTFSDWETVKISVIGLMEGLVAFYPFNGNANDESGNGNHGTLQGNSRLCNDRLENANSAVRQDGDLDCTDLGNPTVLHLQDFTIAAWVKRDDLTKVSASYQDGEIFCYGFGGYGLVIRNTGALCLTQVGSAGFAITDTLLLSDTNWRHIAVTKSGGTVKFYMDGLEESAGPYDPGFVFDTSVAIGARGDDHTGSFLGRIDEVRIYSRALSAAEVQALFQLP